jgi:uncharacterized protein (TIGR02001 family)
MKITQMTITMGALGLALLAGTARADEPAAASATVPAAAPAAAPANPLVANVGLYSQYIFRGISQTDRKPALQGGVDYTHASGAYLGLWGSNISWIADGAPGVSASLELDLYGGYKQSVGDFSYDIGYLRYQYPGTYPAGFTLPHTNEIYGQVGWKFVSLKFSDSLGDTFGVANAKNTYYLDLSAAIPVNEQLTLTGHIGRQKYKGSSGAFNNDIFSYTDYKLEGAYAVSKEWTLGIGYTHTNAARAAYTNLHGNYIGGGQGYAFAKKTF